MSEAETVEAPTRKIELVLRKDVPDQTLSLFLANALVEAHAMATRTRTSFRQDGHAYSSQDPELRAAENQTRAIKETLEYAAYVASMEDIPLPHKASVVGNFGEVEFKGMDIIPLDRLHNYLMVQAESICGSSNSGMPRIKAMTAFLWVAKEIRALRFNVDMLKARLEIRDKEMEGQHG